MEARRISLRSRIFFSMIVLTIFSLLLILFASYLQYNSQSEDYNLRRLFRKETQVKTHLNYLMQRDTAFQQIKERKKDYQEDFASIAVIHKVTYALFTLEGEPLFSLMQKWVMKKPITLFQSKLLTSYFKIKVYDYFNKTKPNAENFNLLIAYFQTKMENPM